MYRIFYLRICTPVPLFAVFLRPLNQEATPEVEDAGVPIVVAVVVVVVVVFTLKPISVSLSGTSFCLNLFVLIQHLTRPMSVVTG